MAALDKMDLHTLLARGAAAGLAAAFNAPLAAVLFVIEETRKQFRYTFRSYVAVILASAASAFAWSWWAHRAAVLKIDTDALPLLLLPVFMVLGVVLGVLGVAFKQVPGDGHGLAGQAFACALSLCRHRRRRRGRAVVRPAGGGGRRRAVDPDMRWPICRSRFWS